MESSSSGHGIATALEPGTRCGKVAVLENIAAVVGFFTGKYG